MHEQMELAEKYHQLTEIATQHNAILQPTFGSLTNVTKSLICTPNITLKTYQFKTHCKGDSHSSKTANIILPGLMIKQR